MSERRPIAEVATVITVTLRVERTEQEKREHRVFPDDGTILRFMDWLWHQKITPLAGTIASGPGMFHATFDPEHREAIEAWLTENEVESC